MHARAWVCLTPAVLLGARAAAQPSLEPAGRPVELTVGRLFVPEGYQAGPEGVHLIVHLHGAHWAAEQALVQSGWHAVVVSVVLNGLSAVYADQFRDPAVFRSLLTEAGEHLRDLGVADNRPIARVTVTSFSAGFGGVRELLKHEDLYERIDALVMADSIHAGFVGNPAERRVDPAAMEGFLRSARDAANGTKQMVVTHSEIQPETYASTTETAAYLLAQLDGQPEGCAEEWAPGLNCTSRFVRGGLRVYGFTGDTGPDHMKHLHHLALLMQRIESP